MQAHTAHSTQALHPGNSATRTGQDRGALRGPIRSVPHRFKSAGHVFQCPTAVLVSLGSAGDGHGSTAMSALHIVCIVCRRALVLLVFFGPGISSAILQVRQWKAEFDRLESSSIRDRFDACEALCQSPTDLVGQGRRTNCLGRRQCRAQIARTWGRNQGATS